MTYLLEVCVSNAIVATALAVVAAMVGRWCHRPALTHTLWLIVLVKLLTPPLVRVPVAWRAAEGDRTERHSDRAGILPIPSGEAALQAREAAGQLDQPTTAADTSGPGSEFLSQPLIAESARGATRLDRWQWIGPLPAVGALWLAGSAWWFAAALVRVVRFHRLLAYGQAASAGLQQEASRIAKRLELERCPELLVVPGRVSPLLWALGGKARLVLPRELLDSLPPEQQATLLAHELAHARRRDHWVRWLEFVALGVYWWHPVVWLAKRAIHRAEEQCCDAWVVWALPGRAREYAEALLETVGFLSGVRCAVPPGASGIGHVQLLRRRLTMILRETLSPRESWRARLAAVLFGLCVLPLAPVHSTAAAAVPGVSFEYGLPLQADTRELERRLDALEKKLDRLLEASGDSAVKSQPGESVKRSKRSAVSVEGVPAQRAKKTVAPIKPADLAPAAPRKTAQKDRPAAEPAKTDTPRVDPEQFAAMARQLADALVENIDSERIAELARQLSEEVKANIDPTQMEQLGRQIGEAVNKSIDPTQIEQLAIEIERAVESNFSPERMEEFERRIEEAVEKNFDTKQFEELGERIEQIMLDNFDPERRKAGPARDAAPKSKAKREVDGATGEQKATKRQTDPHRNDPARPDATPAKADEFEQRMKKLEQKMDRLLEAIESRPAAAK